VGCLNLERYLVSTVQPQAIEKLCVKLSKTEINKEDQMNRKARSAFAVAVALLFILCSTSMALAAGANIHKTPPPNFKKVSTLVKLPDYLPGMGTLYVDPATLPYGPFLGYDKKGTLVNVIYMVPLKDLDDHKAISDLGKALPGLKVNHVDLEFNPGHPGVEEPHYHITLWLISHAEEMKMMK
jgi:hypothetical protein